MIDMSKYWCCSWTSPLCCNRNMPMYKDSMYAQAIDTDVNFKHSSWKMPFNSLNQNYTIKERINNFGEIKQVVVWRNSKCNREFDKLSDFFVHEKVHMKVRPYPCRYCPRAYTQKGNLLKHMRKHTQPDINKRRLYKCEFCQRGYTEKYNLKVRLNPWLFANLQPSLILNNHLA